MWDPYSEFDRAAITNGMSVYSTKWAKREWVAVGFVVHSGANQDPKGKYGLAHFVEHIASRMPSTPKQSFLAKVAPVGTQVSFGSTTHLDTAFSFFSSTNQDELCYTLRFFAEMLLGNKPTPQAIEQERDIIAMEYRDRHPTSKSLEMMEREKQIVFVNRGLARAGERPLGNLESIGSISTQDVAAFRQRHYSPKNISVVSVGGLSCDAIARLLSRTGFDADLGGKRNPPAKQIRTIRPPKENEYTYKVPFSPDHPQDSIAGSYGTIALFPGTTPPPLLWILSAVLSTNINQDIREQRGWTYQVETTTRFNGKTYEFAASIANLSPNGITQIREIVDHRIATLPEQHASFDRAKAAIISRKKLADLSGCDVMNKAMADLARYHRIRTVEEEITDAEKVSFDDFLAAIKWLRPEMRWTKLGTT